MDEKYKNVGHSLIRLIEECSEVIKIASKVTRFGWLNYHPKDKYKTNNFNLLCNEIADLELAIKNIKDHMSNRDNVNPDNLKTGNKCLFPE